jgi:hypothetical protein
MEASMSYKGFAARTAILCVLALSISSVAFGFWFSAMSETDSVKKSSTTKVFKHKLSDEAKGTTFKANLDVKEGGATVLLVDDKGKTRYVKKCPTGKTAVYEDFEGSGEWQVRLDFESATAKYSVSLVDY